MRKCNTGSKKIKSGAIKHYAPPNIQKAFLQQVQDRRIKTTIDNLHIAHAKGVIKGLDRAFKELFPKVDFHCIGKYQAYITNIINYSSKFLAEIKKRNLDLDNKLVLLEFVKLHDLEEAKARKSDENCKKLKVADIGIYKETIRFFEFIDNTYEILENLLKIHTFYTAAETKYIKYIRTYCLKLVEFFNEEVKSDLHNRGVIAE